MSWTPPVVSLLTKIDSSGALVQVFTSLSRELQRLQEEINDLKRKVETK